MADDPNLKQARTSPGLAVRLDHARLWLMTLLSGFLLGGAFLFHSEWTLWHGMVRGVAALVLIGWHRDILAAWRGALLFRVAVVWVLGMLGISYWLGGMGENEAKSHVNWCWGGAGLAAWWVMLFHTGRDAARTRVLGWLVITAAAFSALASVWHFGFMTPDWHWGRRLGNALVYGGWNQVCSGVTWAFAAVWAFLLGMKSEPSRMLRWLAWAVHSLLVFVALASLSRGALMVMVVGHVAALAYGGWKGGGGAALARFLGVFALFHMLLPGAVREEDASGCYPRVIDSNPLIEWTRRADTGRFAMYSAVMDALQKGGPKMWLAGDGQWALNSRWNQPIEEAPLHPHSVFVATALHGGLVGLAGLLVVLSLGLKSCHNLARNSSGNPWPVAMVLAVAGVSGVVFDGHSLSSLDSIPRFEPLIVWPGLLLAAGRWAQMGQHKPRV